MLARKSSCRFNVEGLGSNVFRADTVEFTILAVLSDV
jgi:hypothetical protein